MAQTQVLEGLWEDILAHNAAQLAGRKVKVYIQPEDEQGKGYSLEAAIKRLNSRTPEEITADRKRLLDAAPSPQTLPAGKTLADVVTGQWPGDETDEEIYEALRKLS